LFEEMVVSISKAANAITVFKAAPIIP